MERNAASILHAKAPSSHIVDAAMRGRKARRRSSKSLLACGPPGLAVVPSGSAENVRLFDEVQARTRELAQADPWLIAAGKVLGWTVITDERKTSTKRIPYVCRQQSLQVRCINGPEFFKEAGIV